MKKKFIRRISVLLTLALMLTVVAPVPAMAASGKVAVYVSSNSAENQVYVGEEGYVGAYYTKSGKSVPLKSVTSSDKSILKVKKYKYWDAKGKKYTGYNVVGKSIGNVTVTIKYKVNGKVKTKKKTITVKAYPNAIQSLKVNGKTVKLTGDKKFYYSKKYKKTSAKVKVTPAEGWKVRNVYGDLAKYTKNSAKTKRIKGAKKVVISGKKVKFAKKYNNLSYYIELVNDNGETFSYNVNLWR